MVDVVTFDGPNRIINEINIGTDNTLNATEVYSEWKVWVTQGDNAKFLQAFTPVGGDTISATLDLGITLFLENGWRIRPAEFNHKLTVSGNVFTREEGQSIFTPTLGNFNVNTETLVSNLTDVSRLDLAAISTSVINQSLTTVVPGTLGYAVKISESVTAKNKMIMDNFVYDTNGFMTSARLRVFNTAAEASAATNGGVGEGEILTTTITGIAHGTYNTLPSEVRGVGP